METSREISNPVGVSGCDSIICFSMYTIHIKSFSKDASATDAIVSLSNEKHGKILYNFL